MTNSPLIKDGDLLINANTGDLVTSFDIVTQLTTTLTGYNGIGNINLTSELIAYINQIPTNGIQTNQISTIITNAYNILIKQNLISDLQINIVPVGINYIIINITCVDIEGNNQTLTWSNA